MPIKFYDLPGSPYLAESNMEHYKDACAVLMIADCSDKSTLIKCDELLLEVFEYVPENCVVALVGNKKDISKVETDDLFDIADLHKIDLLY